MVAKQEILTIFEAYFHRGSDIVQNKEYSWDPHGRLNIHTGVSREFGHPMPDGMWPVSFGYIDGDCNMQNCGLHDIEGGPIEVYQDLDLSFNPLTNLKGLTTRIGGRLLLEGIKFQSLDGLPPDQSVEISWYPDQPMLQLLTCKWIELPWHQMQEKGDSPAKKVLTILRKYRRHGRRAMFDCQKELEDAGFEGNARW